MKKAVTKAKSEIKAVKQIRDPVKPDATTAQYVLHSILVNPVTFVDETAKQMRIDMEDDPFFKFEKEVLLHKHKLYKIFFIIWLIAVILLSGSILIGVLSKAAETFGATLPKAVGGIIVALTAIAAPVATVFAFLKSNMMDDMNHTKALLISTLVAGSVEYRHNKEKEAKNNKNNQHQDFHQHDLQQPDLQNSSMHSVPFGEVDNADFPRFPAMRVKSAGAPPQQV
jgi:hypothetical protein